jgi:hypothetical protein
MTQMSLASPARPVRGERPIIQRPPSSPTFAGWGPRLL